VDEAALRFVAHHADGDAGAWARYRIKNVDAADALTSQVVTPALMNAGEWSTTFHEEVAVYGNRNTDFARRTIASLQASVCQYQKTDGSGDRASFSDIYSGTHGVDYENRVAGGTAFDDWEFNYWNAIVKDERYAEALARGDGSVDPADLDYSLWRNVFRKAASTADDSPANAYSDNDILWVKYAMTVNVDNAPMDTSDLSAISSMRASTRIDRGSSAVNNPFSLPVDNKTSGTLNFLVGFRMDPSTYYSTVA
jgi:hypothetical protein